MLPTPCSSPRAVLPPSRTILLGPAYAGTTVNTTIFRHHGLVTHGHYQFTAYYESDARFVVVRRDLRDDALQTGAVDGAFRTVDVHNCISLGVDPSGFVHMAYDHHGVALNYRRSVRPLDVTAWTGALPMTGVEENRVTYPYFLTHPVEGRPARSAPEPGTLMFLYRHGGAGNGDTCLKSYDHQTATWTDLATRFVKGTEQVPWTSNGYWNHPAFDRDGWLHLSWVWRVNQKASAKADFIFNHNHGFAKSPDGARWFTSHGVELSLPMTQVSAETVWPTAPGATVANQCSSSVDSHDRLHIAWHGALEPGGPPQYQHLWFDGARWRCSVLSERTKAFGLLTWDVPMSRPEILIDEADRAHILYRCDLTDQKLVAQRLDPPDYEPPGTITELWPHDLAHSEPIVDRVRWSRDGVLSMLVQRAVQPQLLARQQLPPEPVHIVDWRL